MKSSAPAATVSCSDSENRNGSSGTMPTWSRSRDRRRLRTSWPSMVTRPPVTS
jgi:hypothetical protein